MEDITVQQNNFIELYKNFRKKIDYNLLRELEIDETFKLKKSIELKKYMESNNITISTITFSGTFSTNFFTRNIGYYIGLDKNNIISVFYGKRTNTRTNRSLYPIKYKKQKKIFYNQVTLEIYSDEKKTINIKLFNNGSFQAAGSTSLECIYDILEKLMNVLINKKIKIKKNGICSEINFVRDTENFHLTSLKIGLINCGCSYPHYIDRDKLYYYLHLNDIKCKNDPHHACVHVKYINENIEKPISIFVFQSGSILITSGRNIGNII